MKYVIFDIDGTLAHTSHIDANCFNIAFEKTFGYDISHYDWADIKHVTDWGIMEEIFATEFGRTPQKEEFRRMLANFLHQLSIAREKDQFREVSGAKDFFYHLLNQNQYRLGIATGSWGDSAKLKLEAIGISWKDVAFSHSDYFRSREEITLDVIHRIDLQTGSQADQIIYFGDGVWDFKTTSNLGIGFIGIDVEGNGVLQSLGTKSVFANYLDVDSVLKAINQPDFV